MKYQIDIQPTSLSRLPGINFSNLGFGRFFADHMFEMDYKRDGWENPRIRPFDNLSMHPATSSLHYGQSIFEGLKAQRKPDGNIILFRPDMNIKRMNRSAIRMAMPEIPTDLFMKAMEELILLDEAWIPTDPNMSLYIRPVMFATDQFIGIRRSAWYKFLIFTSPVGAYYSTPVRVYASDQYVRAFPGGTGFAKTAGNYARTIMPVEEIQKKGYHQVLWLDGKEHKYLQEIGTMNIFVVIDGTVITPSLEEGTVLPGITRDSVIQLLKLWNIPVEERAISIDEIIEAHQNGLLEDAFGSGTAATISHIEAIGYKDQEYRLPSVDQRPISIKLRNELGHIKNGEKEDVFGWIKTLSRVPANNP